MTLRIKPDCSERPGPAMHAEPSGHGAGFSAALTYRLRIGVTGHRQLSDPEGVAAAVRRLLNWIYSTLTSRGSAPLQFTMVSPLARGADQIAAQQLGDWPGAELEVITPFVLEDYLSDFEEPGDREAFGKLLAGASRTTFSEARKPKVDARDDEATRQAKRSQIDQQYEYTGRKVVDSSELVIAVWDGKPAGGRGGTGEVVEYALNRGRAVLWIDAANPFSPPRMLYRRESEGDHNATQAVTIEDVRPIGELSAGYAELSRFNTERVVLSEAIQARAEGITGEMRHHAREAGFPETELQSVTALLPLFSKADLLADYYHRQYKAANWGLYGLSAFAVTVAAFQGILFPEHGWLILLEIVAIAIVVLLLQISRKCKWHERWLLYRYLAERVRTAIFMRISGASPEPEGRLGQPLPFYSVPHAWLDAMVDQLAGHAPQSRVQQQHFPALRKFLRAAWIDRQRLWHAGNAARRGSALHRTHRLELILFLATVVVALCHYIIQSPRNEHTMTEKWILFLAVTIPAWASAFAAIRNQLDHERIAVRSRRMVEALHHLGQRVDDALTPAALQETLREAEKVMATELHEWWILISFRRIELPA